MPEICYGGTITFKPDYSLEQKERYINDFTKLLKPFLLYGGGTEYYIKISKEYHKVDGQDDFEAPHLHFVLYTTKALSPLRVRSITRFFNDVYGRSQFYRMTTLKTMSYCRYIQKDSERLFKATGKSHYYEQYLEDDGSKLKDILRDEDNF